MQIYTYTYGDIELGESYNINVLSPIKDLVKGWERGPKGPCSLGSQQTEGTEIRITSRDRPCPKAFSEGSVLLPSSEASDAQNCLTWTCLEGPYPSVGCHCHVPWRCTTYTSSCVVVEN